MSIQLQMLPLFLEPRENAQKDEHRATLMWGPLKEDKNKRNEGGYLIFYPSFVRP